MNPTSSKDSYGSLFRVVGASAVLALLVILCVSIWEPEGLNDRTRQQMAWAAGGIVLVVVVVSVYASSQLGRRNLMQLTAPTPKSQPIAIAIAIAGAVSPWLGIAARLLTPRIWTMAYIGAVLWSANCAGLWYLHHLPETRGKRSLGVSLLVWTLTFVPLFTATAAATNLVLTRH